MWVTDLLQELVYEVLSEKLPELTEATTPALFALFLVDEWPDLAQLFFTRDIHEIPISELARALSVLVDSVCGTEFYRDLIQHLFKTVTIQQADRLAKNRRVAEISSERIPLSVSLSEARAQLAKAEAELKSVFVRIEDDADQLFPLAPSPTTEEEPDEERRDSHRLLMQERKKMRKAHRKAFAEEINNLEIAVKSLQSRVSDLEGNEQRLVDELKEIETADSDRMTVDSLNQKLRGGSIDFLGNDRHGRGFWFFPHLAVILIEPSRYQLSAANESTVKAAGYSDCESPASNKENSVDSAVCAPTLPDLMINDRQWRYLQSASLFIAFKQCLRQREEPELYRSVIRNQRIKPQTFDQRPESADDWKIYLAPSPVCDEKCRRNYLEMLNRLSRRLLKDLHQRISQISAYSKINVKHDWIDAEAAKSYSAPEAEEFNEMDTISPDVLRHHFRIALAMFSDRFFQLDFDCLFCQLALVGGGHRSGEEDASTDYQSVGTDQQEEEPAKSGANQRLLWSQWMDGKSLSALNLFYKHFAGHAVKAVQELRRIGGKLRDPDFPANKATKKRQRPQQPPKQLVGKQLSIGSGGEDDNSNTGSGGEESDDAQAKRSSTRTARRQRQKTASSSSAAAAEAIGKPAEVGTRRSTRRQIIEDDGSSSDKDESDKVRQTRRSSRINRRLPAKQVVVMVDDSGRESSSSYYSSNDE